MCFCAVKQMALLPNIFLKIGALNQKTGIVCCMYSPCLISLVPKQSYDSIRDPDWISVPTKMAILRVAILTSYVQWEHAISSNKIKHTSYIWMSTLSKIRIIQRMWRRAISDPSYSLCKKRLLAEFSEF
jgi:hypothetical protein